jgi:hypothetical protein
VIFQQDISEQQMACLLNTLQVGGEDGGEDGGKDGGKDGGEEGKEKGARIRAVGRRRDEG